MGIQPLWELLEVNGLMKRYFNWRDAVDDLNNCPKMAKLRNLKPQDKVWPLMLVFNVNVPSVASLDESLLTEEEDEETEINVQDVYRTLIMSMGMANQFKSMTSISIEWPPIMGDISFAFSFLSFNMNFVRPECISGMGATG